MKENGLRNFAMIGILQPCPMKNIMTLQNGKKNKKQKVKIKVMFLWELMNNYYSYLFFIFYFFRICLMFTQKKNQKKYDI